MKCWGDLNNETNNSPRQNDWSNATQPRIRDALSQFPSTSPDVEVWRSTSKAGLEASTG